MPSILKKKDDNKNILLEYVKLMRPKQYIKNGFVLAALIFSNNILNFPLMLKSILSFVAFCIISSSAYILNDILDIEKDKMHPKKCNRPLASGTIEKKGAILLGIVLVLLSIVLSLFIHKNLCIIMLLYLFNNIIYSFKLKNIILIDVFSISIGFILRVCAGSIAIEVSLSSWIILCTFFLSLYLGFGKRKKEISLLKDEASSHRKILKEYDEENLNQMMSISLSATIVCYSLYSASNIYNSNMIFTTIFVVYGVLRYNYIVNLGDEGNPTDVVLKDKSLKLCVLLWVITCIIILSI
ncbi:decaprenyl-phosphate phosphoribosyltransferase [Clostridioides difficile]|nr:decaprenyl-phosphate phosphoribosyltransferase [Clostridioides difficile]